ncbi:hypothetical protein M9H77_31151 [Catharanthus roseus]|uniref:Uncharacterized protein n=1 Tax=Catharanthus roseus TaxID=4058 RepID=A0ACB9ZZL4_CATRO|nr:hypothetical protein M9H77_31151 [Catharanthus roseus]
MYFLAMENEEQYSPCDSFSLIDYNCDDDPSSMLIEAYGESPYDKNAIGYNHSNASSKKTYLSKLFHPSPVFVVLIVSIQNTCLRNVKESSFCLRKIGCQIFLKKGPFDFSKGKEKSVIRFFKLSKNRLSVRVEKPFSLSFGCNCVVDLGCLQNPWWVILILRIVVDFDYSGFCKSSDIDSR